MAKSVTAAEATVLREANSSQLVHVVSQGKGGVFKSGISSLLAQYLQEAGKQPQCIDTDPTNATLSQFKGLSVTHLNVATENRVDIERFHQMSDKLVSQDGPFVVDTGATTFLAFWDYVDQVGLIDFLAEHQRKVVVHCPIVGGQSMRETLKGFISICKLLPDASMVAWLNEFFGPISADGKQFEEFTAATENAGKLLGAVRIGAKARHMENQAVSRMINANQTFAEIEQSTASLMERSLIGRAKKAIFSQLMEIGL